MINNNVSVIRPHLLAQIIHIANNKNIYSNNLIQHYLWGEFCKKNIPFLTVLSNYISKQFKEKNICKILFTTRDCIFLKKLFDILYPEIKSETFYSSRALYLFPTEDYKNYCRNTLTPDSLVVDFQGTGQSFTTLASNLNVEPWYLLVNWNFVNHLSYSKERLQNYKKKIIIREKTFFDDTIEKLNIDLVGTYFDYKNEKAISYTYEYDTKIISAFHKCFDVFASIINTYDIEVIKQYEWDDEFNKWMDLNYTTSPVINSIKWIHTHFDYNEKNINLLRQQYNDTKISKIV